MKSPLPLMAQPLDSRQALQIVEDILARAPGYLPSWSPPEEGPDAALVWIVARYLESIFQRLNRAPEKNKLAFLDLLGIELIPAQAARVPVVFELSDQATDSRIPARTRLVAPPPPESTEQIVFETERGAGLTAGKLKEVVSLWPGRAQYIDHSAAFLEGQVFQPFHKPQLQDTPHILYIANDTLLALAGKVRLDVEFELLQTSDEHLDLLWEYWDGKVWRGFKAMQPSCAEEDEQKLDGTNGLTRSGRFRLESDCAEAQKTSINGIEAYWVRAKLTEPLLPDPAQILPEVDGVRLSSIIERPLPETTDTEATDAQGLLPDQAFADTSELDLTKPFFPYGNQPLPGNAFYFSSEEIFSKPGANVEISVVRSQTPQDKISLPGPPAIIRITPNPLVVEANGEDESIISIEIIDVKNAPVVDGTVVRLNTTLGDFENLPNQQELELNTTGGIAQTRITSNTAGTARITAKSGFASNTTAVFFSEPPVIVEIVESETTVSSLAISTTDSSQIQEATRLEPEVAWEYWNDKKWTAIPNISNNNDLDLDTSTTIRFSVPLDMARTTVNNQENFWIRVRLVKGGFGFIQPLTWTDTVSRVPNQLVYIVTQPPALSEFRLGYIWQYGPFYSEHVLAYNDFQYEDRTDDAKWPGTSFQPFKPVSDATPALYLGFDKKLPVDRLNLYFDILEQSEATQGPELLWEYWNGFNWRDLSVEDGTYRLRVPGMLSFIAAADSHPLARFGTSLHWLRARLKEDGPPGAPTINSVFPNAVLAIQQQTITDDPLGTSNGQPNQVFNFRQLPILAEEQIEVRELAGRRANVEWRILAMELLGEDLPLIRSLEERLGAEGPQTDIEEGPLRLRRDRNKRVTEVWVRWQGQKHLLASVPNDRHYVLESTWGRLLFGDGERGSVPPPGAAILAKQYRTGGGLTGNVAARTITQVQGAIPGIETVFNPKPAEGGAQAETLEVLSSRGPKTLRHRGRGISAEDYETLAKEASPAVAVARAMPTRDPSDRLRPGWVTLLIIPQSSEPRPWPSFGLRERVRKFIEARVPADLAVAHRIHVTGPEYLAIDIVATIVPIEAASAGVVEQQAREALETFLHPLHGGPEGSGWDLGRDVFLSDVASVLERVKGVDYVKELALLLNGALQQQRVRVADDRIVVAGEIRLKIQAS